MICNPKNLLEKARTIAYFTKLIEGDEPFELTKKKLPKTLKQMRYVHLIMGWHGLETGYTLQEIKQDIVKRQVCKDIFKYEKANTKTGETTTHYESFSRLEKDELRAVIERFRNYSSKVGTYLPEPHERDFLQQIDTEMRRQADFLLM